MGEKYEEKEFIIDLIGNIKPIKMTIEDLPQIAEIFISYWGTKGLYPDIEFERIINQDISFVYKINNEVIAFCLIEYLYEKDTIEIDILCVKREFKGNHLGKSLLSYCINYCNELDFKNYALHVSTTNTPAFNLYKKLGFVIKYFIKNYYNDEKPEDSDAYFMILNM